MPQNDVQITKKDYLEIFARTGHESLKAILIVCAGSVVAFLAFIGTILSATGVAENFGPDSMAKFFSALTLFIVSVFGCLLSHALSFWSHAYFYHDQERQGKRLTVIAGLVGIACIFIFLMGGLTALSGLKAASRFKQEDKTAAPRVVSP